MLNPSTLHDLVAGQRRGIGGVAFRALTSIAELPVAWYVRRKNQQFDSGSRQTHKVDAPVISVGNLTVGGTGKTPMAQWIARHLQQQGRQVVLISRGYGAKSGQANDEARELAAKLPGVPHLQNPDRVAAAELAVKRYPGAVLLLDDAFQHRRLHRDLDIVLLDALSPFGFDHLLPRGLLREPIEGLKRAQAVVLSRASLVDENTRQGIRERVGVLAPNVVWAEANHAPMSLVDCSGNVTPLSELTGKRLAAFCGIGNPLGFRRTLEGLESEIVAWKEFPDHCAYGPTELKTLELRAKETHPDAFICTHKDLVKISRMELAGRPLKALVIGLQFTSGQIALADLIANAVERATA